MHLTTMCLSKLQQPTHEIHIRRAMARDFASHDCTKLRCVRSSWCCLSGGPGADQAYSCGVTTTQMLDIGKSDTVNISPSEPYCLV